MITEDYVSFELAKLLKEKGFDWECICINHPPCGTSLIGHTINNTGLQLTREAELCIDKENLLTIPTLQMAMKWLREVHNIETSISYGFPFIDGKRVFKYYWCPVKVTEKGLEYPMDDPDTVEFIEGMADSYEQAVEETIKYSLENLI